MKLRRPTDRLADCLWLPRFIDKTRHHLAGTLEPDFALPFCHPVATDGLFLAHFEIGKDEIIRLIADSKGSNALVAQWFEGRPQYTPERVKAWNEQAPNIGKEGHPGRRGFLWILKQYYGGIPPDPRVDSAFTAIAFDEGYLDEMTSRSPAERVDKPLRLGAPSVD